MSLLQGAVILAITLSIFGFSRSLGHTEGEARALTFVTLVIANLGLIFSNRSWSRTIVSSMRSKNKALWWIVASAIIFLALVVYVPFLRDLFKFEILHANDVGICVAAGAFSTLCFEAIKFLSRRWTVSR